MIRNGYYIASDACGRDKNGKFVCVCGKCRVMTNADRIRSMTDEELAEHFTQFYYDGPKFYCPAVADVGEGACAANYDCRQCWLDWLKQEAEE